MLMCVLCVTVNRREFQFSNGTQIVLCKEISHFISKKLEIWYFLPCYKLFPILNTDLTLIPEI